LLGPDEALLSSIGVDREQSERLRQQLYAELWLELDELKRDEVGPAGLSPSPLTRPAAPR
jgi:hypothetical protein